MVNEVSIATLFHFSIICFIPSKVTNVQVVFNPIDLRHGAVVHHVDVAEVLVEDVYVARIATAPDSSLLFTIGDLRYLTVLHICRVSSWLVFVVVQLLLSVGIELLQERHVIELFFEAAAVRSHRDLAREVLAVN